ncbi:MAG: GAF domain-containing protein [Candidatus Zixiibacteriota bacterium]|nr:MAG: GAF domain-containing protein [candidate division Zixibacteria bacterium]
MQIFDFVVALIFLLALIAVSRFRRYLTAEDRESYRHIVSGLTILAVVSLAKIYSGLGLLRPVPFLSDLLFFRLIFWIGIITGLTFLISGVTSWVPLSRSYRKYNRERIEKLEFIKKVEQLLRVETRLPHILENALDHMVNGYRLAGGAVYVYPKRKSTPIGVAWHDPTDVPSGQPAQVIFNERILRQFPRCGDLHPDRVVDKLPDGVTIPDMIVPVSAGKRLVAFFMLWVNPTAPMSDEDRMNLKIAGDIIGNAVSRDLLERTRDFGQDLKRWYAHLVSHLDYRSDTHGNVSMIVNSLRKQMAVDFFSLTFVRDDGMACRYTIGEADGLLTESNIDFAKSPSTTNFVYRNKETLRFDDLNDEVTAQVDEIITRNGYRSLILHPVQHGVNVEGVMTVASREPFHFTRQRCQYIEAVLPAVAGVAVAERYRLEAKARERRGYILNNFLSHVTAARTYDDVFERAAAIIATELKPSVVRLSTVDNRGPFLQSRALEIARSSQSVIPARGSMILSLMQYHQLVIDTGRPMMINQQSTDRKMTEAEKRQAFGVELNSALLVPIRVGEMTLGVISLAETRAWSRYQFRPSDIQFVTAVAAVIATAVQLDRIRQLPAVTGDEDTDSATRSRKVEQTRGRIRSSLSGIMGSVELLRSGPQPSQENLNRCLSIIDKSARRISEYVTANLPE